MNVGTSTGRPAGARDAAAPARAVSIAGSVAVLVLVDVRKRSWPWAWTRLPLQGLPLRGITGLRFAKVLGSGAGGGFGLWPSASHQGLYLVFDDEPAARDFVDRSALLAAYRHHARECCVAMLRASASRGSWSGRAMAVTAQPDAGAPVAALTRASIRPSRALAFWRHSPASEAALAAAPGCLLAAGLGEAPVLRQATFSLWTSVQAMDAYARSGAHQEAIRAAYTQGYFSETMFVRYVPLQLQGTWQGRRHG